MKHYQGIKTEHSDRYRYFILSTIFLGVLTILSCKEIFVNPYFDIIGLIAFLSFLGLTLASLNYWVNRTEIEISKERIVLKNKLRKKIISRSEIQGFKEEEYKRKYEQGKRLIFKTKNNFLLIDSKNYSNYYQVVGYVRKNFKKLSDDQFKQYDFYKKLYWRVFYFLFALFFLVIFFNERTENIDDLEKDIQLTRVTLLERPTIESSGSKSNRHYIQIFVKEYPEFKFKISGFRYNACNKSLINELQKEDKIIIGVKSNDLESKMKKLKNPSFKTKHFLWEQIAVYQLNYQNKEYLDLHKVMKMMRKNKSSNWVFLLFGLFFLYMTMGDFFKSKPAENSD